MLAFPRELIWLTGAPGAGKGTHIATILKERDLVHTVEVSSLLTGPTFEAIKASGRLVSDSDVVHAVLRVLLDPKHAAGVVLDGFPRTATQAASIVLLAERLEERCVRFAAHPSAEVRARSRKPRFTLTTLWCEEDVSVRRQMSRGAGLARAHSIAASVGISDASTPQARQTDLDEARARTRYAAFSAEVAACLAITKGHVRSVFIDASGSAEEVQSRVRKAFSYSAALDLDEGVYDQLRPIKSASNLVKCARSALVARLSTYGRESPGLLARVVEVLRCEFFHIMEQQALMGCAVVRSQNPLLLGDRKALVMALDVLAERGYNVVLDVQLTHIPHTISGSQIVCKREKVLQFSVTWARPEVRDGGE
jgi:adenylate kinase